MNTLNNSSLSFIQQKFIEYLPHARYWEHSGEINDKSPCSHVAHILAVEDNQTKIKQNTLLIGVQNLRLHRLVMRNN